MNTELKYLSEQSQSNIMWVARLLSNIIIIITWP